MKSSLVRVGSYPTPGIQAMVDALGNPVAFVFQL
jgi:hypothetical protein